MTPRPPRRHDHRRKDSRLRVAHVVQPTSGGVPRVVVTLATAGRLLGHDVVVLCPDGGTLGTEVCAVGIERRSVAMTRAPSAQDLRAVFALRNVMRSFDIVHLHSSKAAAIGRLARLLSPACAYVVVVPHAWSWFVGGRLKWLYRSFERVCCRLADVFVAVSEGERDAGRRVLGSEAPIVVINNGVDVDRFYPSYMEREPGRTTIVVVGRLCEQKGQDRALRTVALLPECFEMILVGDGPERDSLMSLTRELGIESRVRFAGETEPLSYFHAADIVLVPSRWEGLSLSMLEAMSCACSVVATAVSGTEVLDGESGVVLPVDASPELMASVIRQLAGDEELRSAMGTAARNRVVEHYSMGLMLHHYSSLWNELAR